MYLKQVIISRIVFHFISKFHTFELAGFSAVHNPRGLETVRKQGNTKKTKKKNLSLSCFQAFGAIMASSETSDDAFFREILEVSRIPTEYERSDPDPVSGQSVARSNKTSDKRAHSSPSRRWELVQSKWNIVTKSRMIRNFVSRPSTVEYVRAAVPAPAA